MGGTFSAEHIARGRELVATDREARLDLGELLLEVAPSSPEDDARKRAEADRLIEPFAAAIGLSLVQARQYRKVASELRKDPGDVLEDTGVTASYAAIRAAVLRQGGSFELLVGVCRKAAAEGRQRVSVTDVEVARRAIVKAESAEKRRERTDEQSERVQRERHARREALAAYRDGIAQLIAQRVTDGTDEQEAEIAVLRDIASRIADEGGNPADLLDLGSDVIDHHADVVRDVRRRASEQRATGRRLNNAEATLRRLADRPIQRLPPEAVDEWLATLDRIITHSVSLAEQLREGGHATQ